MKSLGLDPSLRSFGWAVIDTDFMPTSGSIPTSKYRVASGHEGTLTLQVPVARFIHFRTMVGSLINRFNPDVIGIESPAFGGGPFSENHFGLMLFSLEAVFGKRKNCILFDPTTLKYLTGNAKASKQDMQRFAQIASMEAKTLQSDEADGLCVAHFAARFEQLKTGILHPDCLTIYEKKVFLERKKQKKTSFGHKVIKRTAHIFRENSRYFNFSIIPEGDVNLPSKSQIRPELLEWIDSEEI